MYSVFIKRYTFIISNKIFRMNFLMSITGEAAMGKMKIRGCSSSGCMFLEIPCPKRTIIITRCCHYFESIIPGIIGTMISIEQFKWISIRSLHKNLLSSNIVRFYFLRLSDNWNFESLSSVRWNQIQHTLLRVKVIIVVNKEFLCWCFPDLCRWYLQNRFLPWRLIKDVIGSSIWVFGNRTKLVNHVWF